MKKKKKHSHSPRNFSELSDCALLLSCVDRVQAAGAEGWTIVEAASLSQPSGFPRIAPG